MEHLNKKLLILFLLPLFIYAQDNDLQINHIYFVLDSLTYSQIKNSTELQKFAAIDQGLPKFQASNSSTTTLYLRGRNTYIEIMGPENKFKEPVGAVGIGFYWETDMPFKADFETKKMRSGNCPEFQRYDAKYTIHEKELLWYTSFSSINIEKTATWYAFYNPTFLEEFYEQPAMRYTASDFLKKAYSFEKDFIDIEEIALKCTSSDYERIKNELLCLGSTIIYSDNNQMSFQIKDILFTIKKSIDNNSGIQKVVLKTNNKTKSIPSAGKMKFTTKKKKVIIDFK